MFIDRFYDWFGEKIDDVRSSDDCAVLFVIYAIIWLGGGALLFFLTSPTVIIYAAVITLILSELAYFDKLKRAEKTYDTTNLIFTKIGYILGAFLFVTYPLVVIYNYMVVFRFFTKPEVLQLATTVLIFVGIEAVVILYFFINVKLGNKVLEENQKKKKRGKKK